jgi:hypothetical protein
VRAKDSQLAQRLGIALRQYEQHVRPLPGVATPSARQALLEQLVESVHRVEYLAAIQRRPICDERADPSSNLFDPLRAALVSRRRGDFDEAAWLVFLFVQFGKHRTDGYGFVRDVYGALNSGARWTWARTSGNPGAFQQWLAAHGPALQKWRFGGHRPYETLKLLPNRGTPRAVASYVQWVGSNRGHQALFSDATDRAEGDRGRSFDLLYRSMNVASFGRLGKFDYLTMIGKLGLAPIEPASPYLVGASGPLRGAQLLFAGAGGQRAKTRDLDRWASELGIALGVGMQVIEDSLCNWQKSPERFIPFRG